MQNKNTLLITLTVALILLVPLIAMQLTDEVAWSPFDFAFAGALLFAAGLAFELITRKAGNRAYRAALGIALMAAVLLVWINLAVGIIGSEDNPANMLYIGVLAILIFGSLTVRFRPQGMARVIYVTALAQVVVPVIALMIWRPEFTSAQTLLQVLKVAGVNGLFLALWAGSGWLFQRANANLNRPQYN